MTNDHDTHDESPFGQGPFDDAPSHGASRGGGDPPAEPTPLGSEPTPLGSEPTPLGSEATPLGSEATPLGSEATPLGSEATPLDAAASRPADVAGSGLLDDLRDLGEETVSAEIESMTTALRRVDEFTEHVDTANTADLTALQTEWREIEADLKRALSSGLVAARVTAGPVHDSVISEEIQGLEGEVERKNDLIAQLSQTVDRMNRELDQKERSHRLELRGLRDRMVELDDEVGPLREKGLRTEAQLAALSEQLELFAEERDEARRAAQKAQGALESEGALQDERVATLEAELGEVRKELAGVDTERRAAERRVAELEKRFDAADKARASAETERDARSQEAARASREAESALTRATGAESRLLSETERLEKELKDGKRREASLRAEFTAGQSRMQQALASLQGALSTLSALPTVSTDGETDPADGPPGDESESSDDRG